MPEATLLRRRRPPRASLAPLFPDTDPLPTPTRSRPSPESHPGLLQRRTVLPASPERSLPRPGNWRAWNLVLHSPMGTFFRLSPSPHAPIPLRSAVARQPTHNMLTPHTTS